ncbi:hypothetical protein NTE_01375 [Candidatus Nitrososphaera evergladensis SR1]|uniref:Uncharacterized protein n=2 Tax=Nitrososphaera TaxID=497726 RepID=A0A075MQF4_9ARCH|nr:hypothetical protein NTE_01375 [Candidatus Nitrososphaera evergladensis SR1]
MHPQKVAAGIAIIVGVIGIPFPVWQMVAHGCSPSQVYSHRDFAPNEGPPGTCDMALQNASGYFVAVVALGSLGSFLLVLGMEERSFLTLKKIPKENDNAKE